MAKISGENGACTHDGTTVKITQWDVEVSTEIINTTDSGSSGWEENIGNGWKKWSGSFEGFVETGDTGLTVGASATLVLTADSGITWTGTGIIQSKGTSLQIAGTDAVKVSYSFTGSGSLTEANP